MLRFGVLFAASDTKRPQNGGRALPPGDLLEGLLARVRAYVVVERGGAGKGASAVAALEGPVAGVRHHVVAQLGRLREGQRAMAALVRPSPGGNDRRKRRGGLGQ